MSAKNAMRHKQTKQGGQSETSLSGKRASLRELIRQVSEDARVQISEAAEREGKRKTA